MKKIISIVTLVTFLSSTSFAFAMGDTAASASSSKLQEKLMTRETNLKTRADNEITRRTLALNTLITRINTMKRLSAAQKATFVNGIQTEITNLTALKAKIDADTDQATLKTDVQSIVQSYRVYALYMPQVRILAAADSMGIAIDKLTSVSAMLQTDITNAKNAGKDVTALQTALTDMQAKITDATTQTTNAQNVVVVLTPAGFPGNKTTLIGAQTTLKSARQDLKAALDDAKTIRHGLKELGLPGDNSSSNSAK